MFRQGMRMRLWVLVPPAIIVLVLADLSSPRFDPVFEAIPAAFATSLLVMEVLAIILGIFFATYSIPAEMESKVAQSVVTKPVGAAEIVAGKTLGMSLLLAAMLAAVGAGGYIYILIRASAIQSLARERLAEAAPRAAHPADLNALEAVAARGPLHTYRYYTAGQGPDIGLDLGPGRAASGGAQWILGETGMRITWRLGDAPLREWVAAGRCRLRLALEVESTGGPVEAPVPVAVALLPAGADINRVPASEPGCPIRLVNLDLPPSGRLEVPAAAPDAHPHPGVLNVPPEGDLVVDLLAVRGGSVIGARPGSLCIIGPAGQEFIVKSAPEAIAARQRQRVSLAGRSRLPRQVADFRFEDVPADELADADTAVEIGASLDAWSPALVQAAAEIAFVRPDGRRKALQFSPESHHPSIVYLDRTFWHGGPLGVQLQCLTDEDYLGLVPESVRLRLGGGPFLLNYAKAILMVWLFGTVLAAAGVAASTRLTWYVGVLATLVFFVLAGGRDFIMKLGIFVMFFGLLFAVLILGGIIYFVFLKRGLRWYQRLARVGGLLCLWVALNWLFAVRVLGLVPLPSIVWLLPGEGVIMGQVIPNGDIGTGFALAAVGSVVLVLAGTLLLKTREVAA